MKSNINPDEKKTIPLDREKCEILFDSNRDSIILYRFDAEGNPTNFIEANPACIKLLGYSKKELLELNIRDLKPNSNCNKEEKTTNLHSKGDNYFETVIKTKEGHLINVEIKTVIVIYNNEPAVLNIIRDITEQKEIEELNKKSLDNLSTILEAIPDLLFEVDLEGKIYYFQGNRNNLLLLPESEFLGKNFRDFLPKIATTICLEAIQEALEKGWSSGKQYELKMPNGNYWFELSVSPIAETGKVNPHFIVLSRDITDRKIAEEKLHFEKERIRTILELVGSPIFLKDNEHKITFANSAFYNLFCLDESSVIGKTLFEQVPENERIHFQKIDRTVLDTGIPDVREEELTVQGIKNTIITSKTRFIDAEGNKSLVGSIYNITDRKIAEEQLIQHHATFKAVLESSNSYVFSLDTNYCYTSFNTAHIQEMKKIYGVDIEIGHSLLDYMVVEEDREIARKNIDRALRGERFVDSAYSGDQEQNRQYYEITHNPIFDDLGKVIGVSLYCLDITNRKQAEIALRKSQEKLEGIFNLANSGIVMIDKLGHFLLFNDWCHKLLGYSRNEFQKLSITDVSHPDDFEKSNALNNKLIQGKIKNYVIEKRYIKKDKSIIWCEVSASAIKDEENNVVNIIGIINDITERKKAKIALQKSELQLVEAQTLAKVGSWETDFTFNNATWSKEAGKIFGIDPKATKFTLQEFLNIIHPEDLFLVQSTFVHSIKKRTSNKLVHRIITHEGVEKTIEERWKIIRDINGKSLYAIGTSQDITEQKQAEDNLKESKRFAIATLDALPFHIAILDENGFIIAVNEAWNKFRDSNSPKSKKLNPSIGENYLNICQTTEGPNSEEGQAMAEGIRSVMKGEKEEFSLEYPCHSPTMKSWFNARVTRFMGSDSLKIVVSHENTTERKLNEELLEQSKTRFSSIINSSSVAMALNDENQNITYINQAFVEMFGYTLDEIPTVFDWFPKAYPDIHYREKIINQWFYTIEKSKKEGVDFLPMEVTIRCKNGTDKIVMVSANPLLHSYNSEYLINFYDITELKLAKSALENEKRRLSLILIATDAGTWEWNVQTGALFINERYAEIIGYSLYELFPLNFDTWRKYCHPEDLILAEKNVENHLQGKLDYYESELRMMHKNGDWVWVLARGKIIEWDIDGNPLIMSGTHQDISDRKNAAERLKETSEKFQDLVNSTGGIVWEADAKTFNFTYVSKQAERLLGYTINEWYKEGFWAKHLHPDDKDFAIDYSISQTKLMIAHDFTYRFISKKGQILWLRNIVNVVIENGKPRWLRGVMFDITHLKETYLLLSESEEKYRGLVENSPDGILIYVDDKISYINSQGIRILGAQNKEQILGKSVLRFVHPTSMKNIIKRMKEANKNRNATSILEEKFVTIDGTPFDVEIKAIPTLYQHKKAVQVIIHDITKNKQTSIELNKINRVYALISQINNLILRTHNKEDLFQEICNIAVTFGKFRMSWIGLLNEDKHTIMTAAYAGHEDGYFTNKNVASVLNIKEGIGPTVIAFREGRTVISNDIATDPLTKPWRKDALKRGYSSVISIPIIVRNKKIGNFNLYSTETNFFTSEEEISLLEKIVLNISFKLESLQIEEERKLSEEKIRQLSLAVEQNPASIEITNTKGEIEYVNQKFLESTGYKVEEVLGKNPRILKSGHTTAAEYKNLWKTISKGNEWHGEFYNRRKDGTFLWESTTISPITNNEGVTTHYLAIKENITERKHAEQELINAKLRAEESDRLKLVFLANMSHEIRTPMNGILGFTELLKTPHLTGKEQKEYIDIIEKSGKRMLNIINDIISISKIESGQIEVNLSETDINEQINYIFTFFKPETKQRGIKLFIAKELPTEFNIIKTDKEKLYAILANLIKNAIKFTKEGFIEFGCEKKGNYLECFVKDSGIGITKEHKKIIFERFRQANDSISRSHEGSGLGLAISKAYVEMLGGKIWVESEEGKGSTFFFTIPYHYDNEPHEKIVTEKVFSENKIKDLKVLIVEDDAISKLLITIAVKPYSKEIMKVSNGYEAIEACRNNPDIDLVMMDINMPEMGGYEATQHIRKFNKDLIIIAQTANGMQSDRDNALAAGCTDYISKPININSLSDLINKYYK
nr:PAS domain S-box protein [uncultured Flavobacterium sp.]